MLEVYAKYYKNAGRNKEVFSKVRGPLISLSDILQALHIEKYRKDSSHRGNNNCKDVIESWNSIGFTQFDYDW